MSPSFNSTDLVNLVNLENPDSDKRHSLKLPINTISRMIK